jgi:hypothetical protein
VALQILKDAGGQLPYTRDTASEALKHLRAFGFLDWTRCLIRGAGTGWRTEQTSNAYVLRVPACNTEIPERVPLVRFKKGCSGRKRWLGSLDRERDTATDRPRNARSGLLGGVCPVMSGCVRRARVPLLTTQGNNPPLPDPSRAGTADRSPTPRARAALTLPPAPSTPNRVPQ